jgi:hypothetical protein
MSHGTRRGRTHAIAACPDLFLVVLLMSAGGCSDSPVRPDPEPEPDPLVFEARVNVQLGNTAVGTRPLYVVTSSLNATQGTVRREAVLDSVTIEYSRNDDAWTRLRLLRALPFSDRLPFTVEPADVYRVMARLYATAFDGDGNVYHQIAEWQTSGTAIPQ